MGPVHLRLDSRIRRRTWSKLKPSPIFLTIREADLGSFFPGAELQHAFHDPLRTRRLFCCWSSSGERILAGENTERVTLLFVSRGHPFRSINHRLRAPRFQR